MDQAQYIAALINVLQAVVVMRYIMLVSLVLLVWDALLTWDVEYERIWKSKDTLFKLCWAGLRYFPIIGFGIGTAVSTNPGFASPTVITGLAIAASIFSIVANIVAQGAFITRIYALYMRSKRVLFVLIPLFIGHLALCCAVVAVNVPRYWAETPSPLPTIKEIPTKEFAITLWVYQGLFDCVVVGLTIYKGVKLSKENVETPLLHVLIRDGCGYFAVMIVIYAVTILHEIFSKPPTRAVFTTLTSMMPLLLSQRLILNLRSVPHAFPAQETEPDFDELTRPHELQAVNAAVTAGTTQCDWKGLESETFDSTFGLSRDIESTGPLQW